MGVISGRKHARIGGVECLTAKLWDQKMLQRKRARGNHPRSPEEQRAGLNTATTRCPPACLFNLVNRCTLLGPFGVGVLVGSIEREC